MRKSTKLIVSAALCIAFGAFAADGPDFLARPLKAGRAALAEDGFYVERSFGVANFTPELAWPVQLIYSSVSEKTGAFGFAWRSPQLESSAAWDKDGLLWVTPWGERVKFFPKKEKAPKDAVKIELWEDAKKGRGFYAPYSDWEADTAKGNPAASGDWTFSGRRSCVGWRMVYRNSRLARVEAPSGRAIDFAYDKSGRPVSVSQDGLTLVEVAYGEDGLASSVSVNGVETRLAYKPGQLSILPKTLDGQIVAAIRPRLASLRTGGLDAEEFAYSGNHLAGVRQGRYAETFKVDEETVADRRRNLRSARPKAKERHSGHVSGRLLADGSFVYSYGEERARVALRQGRAHGEVFLRLRDWSVRRRGLRGAEAYDLLFHALRRGVSGQGAQGGGREGA